MYVCSLLFYVQFVFERGCMIWSLLLSGNMQYIDIEAWTFGRNNLSFEKLN